MYLFLAMCLPSIQGKVSAAITRSSAYNDSQGLQTIINYRGLSTDGDTHFNIKAFTSSVVYSDSTSTI